MGVINEDFFISNNKTELESILMERIDDELEKMLDLGYKLVDRYKSEPYTLILFHNMNEDSYEIGLTTDEEDFTTFNSQKTRTPKHNINFKESSKKLITKIKEWLKSYGNLYVGSFNERRVQKYHRIFGRLGFSVGEIQYTENDGLPPSWDFLLKNKHSPF